MCPVTGRLVKGDRTDAGRQHVLIAELQLLVTNVVLELSPNGVTAGQKHRKTAADQVVRHEETHLLADLSVIAGLRLLHLLLILRKFLRRRESNAVDPGEHLIFRIVLPVCTALHRDLKRLQSLRVRDVRADAHVDIIALLIERDPRVLRKIADVLLLVLRAALVQKLQRLRTWKFERLEGEILLRDLLHLIFDRNEILVRQLAIPEVDVVVEASLRRRAVRKIGIGIQSLDRLRHDMRRGMSEYVRHFLCGTLRHRTVVVDNLHRLLLPLLSQETSFVRRTGK